MAIYLSKERAPLYIHKYSLSTILFLVIKQDNINISQCTTKKGKGGTLRIQNPDPLTLSSLQTFLCRTLQLYNKN